MKNTLKTGIMLLGLGVICGLLAGCGLATLQSTQAALPDHNQGMADSRAGRYSAAIASFDRALAVNPRLGASLRGRGDAHLARKDFDAAIADYTKFLASVKAGDYANSWVYIYRAEAYYGKGDYDRAWADVHSARAGGLVI